MCELWAGERIRDIKEFEGVYAVTDHGRVWSYRRKKWLTPFVTGKGYYSIHLSVKGKEVDRKVHRLVGEAFLKNPNNYAQINHKNGDKKNCHYKNLEWVTARQNIQHACDLGLTPHHKLSFEDKITVCQLYHICHARKSYIAKTFGISPPGVHYLINEYSDIMLQSLEAAGHC